MGARQSGESTFAGRCRVRTAYPPGARPSGSGSWRARSICWSRRIDHGVADEVDLLGGDTFVPQILVGHGVGCEQEIRNRVRAEAVDLFRHGHVARAQSGFDVSDADAEFLGGEGAGNRRVHVSHDDHPIRTMFQARRLERHHDARGLLGMRAGAHLQVDVGLGNAEVAEEVVRHVPAVVLAGVDEEQIGGGMPVSPRGERPVNRGDLHEVRAGAGY